MRTHSFLLMIILFFPLQNVCMEPPNTLDYESPRVFYNIESSNNTDEQTNNDIYRSVASLITIYNLIPTSSEQNNLPSFNIFYSPKQEHLCNIVCLHFPSLCFENNNEIFRPEYTDNAIISDDNQGGFWLNITALRKTLPYVANKLLHAYKSDLQQKINAVNNQMLYE